MFRAVPSILLTIAFLSPAFGFSQGAVGSLTRSDSIDLLHTRVELDLTQVNSGLIRGKAVIRFAPRVNGVTHLPFDLLQLNVDSVVMNGALLPFTHVGEYLNIDLGTTLDPLDTADVAVYYGGDPAVDASGWGGFYTLSSYQYDLGVAFDAVPHSYGRSWFPCFDNFVERCTFEFLVHTNNSRTVFANGALVDVQDLGGGEHIHHWRMAGPIPSYLASVASTDYVAARDTFPSISGQPIPVTLVAKPADTTDMKNSFIHLRNAFDTYEHWFGPYRWERVGYCLTTQGAMEHPTNISYPASIADGTLTNEDIMAHELSHHWFGDLVTCQRAEEMYINEGFAEYCSYLFEEALYGRARYEQKVAEVHHTMVSRAHLIDGGWYALADVPQEDTYGEHSYRKGADIAHTLRSYLGDSLFRAGFTRVFANNAYSDMSSAELRDSLSSATGTDLTHFFDDWIFQPGWAAFEVDSMSSVPDNGYWNTTLHIQQKLRHADHLYQQVPVTLTFESATGERWSDPQKALLGGEFSQATSQVPFQPAHAFLNADGLLALATGFEEDTITSTTTYGYGQADLTILATSVPAPSPLRVEEFWTAADPNTVEPYAFAVSPDRWWRITGQLQPGTVLNARFTIDGRQTSPTLFDPDLVQNAGATVFAEDSLVLLYRPDPRFAWAVHPDIDINFLGGSTVDGYARITANGITTGDYCVAWRKSAVGVHETVNAFTGWRFYPDPAKDKVTVVAPSSATGHGTRLILQDVHGRTLKEVPVTSTRTTLDVQDLPAQSTYLTAIIPGHGAVSLGTLLIAP